MAETFTNVTEGSGKKLHAWDRTIGANTVLDEVVVLGDQYLASYTLNSQNTSIATANDHILQIMAGASLNVYIRRIVISQSAAATAAGIISFAFLRLTTAGTGGTARTPAPHDTTDAASGATGMTLPTVKGTEGTEIHRHYAQTIQTVSVGGPASATILLDWDCDRMRVKPWRIAAGTANGLAVKSLVAAAAATINISVVFTEQNF
jgi:hypothetical protein